MGYYGKIKGLISTYVFKETVNKRNKIKSLLFPCLRECFHWFSCPLRTKSRLPTVTHQQGLTDPYPPDASHIWCFLSLRTQDKIHFRKTLLELCDSSIYWFPLFSYYHTCDRVLDSLSVSPARMKADGKTVLVHPVPHPQHPTLCLPDSLINNIEWMNGHVTLLPLSLSFLIYKEGLRWVVSKSCSSGPGRSP